MRGLTIFILMCFVFALGCSSKDEENNGASNNGAANNGASNNGNNGTANNKSNNGTANNTSNNGSTNNGQTVATNNATTTAVNNGTLPSVSVNCAEADLTDCFSNFDCQETEVCTNVSDNATEIACCVTGTRGAKVVGDDCTDDDDTTCDSGICIGSNDSEKRFCSAPCGLDTECPDFMKCVSALGVCAEGTRD